MGRIFRNFRRWCASRTPPGQPPDAPAGLADANGPQDQAPTAVRPRPPSGRPNIAQESDSMTQAQTEAKPAVARNQAVQWLRQMLLIRRFEERSAMLYQNQKIGGFCHLYSGQEPVSRRLDRRAPRGRLRHHRVPRPRPRPGPRHGRRSRRWPSCSARSPAAPRARAARCTSSTWRKGFLGGHAIVGSHVPGRRGRRLRHQVPPAGPGLSSAISATAP